MMRFIFLISTVSWFLAGIFVVPGQVAAQQDRAAPINIEFRDGKAVGPRVIRVKQGDDVKLQVKVDKVMELHLHGYDIEKVAKPDAAANFSFVAKATGRFPLTEHGTGHSHGHGESALMYLEVHPR